MDAAQVAVLNKLYLKYRGLYVADHVMYIIHFSFLSNIFLILWIYFLGKKERRTQKMQRMWRAYSNENRESYSTDASTDHQ